MASFLNRSLDRLRAAFHPSQPWVARTQELGRSRRVRKIGVIVVAVVLFLGLATYIAVPLVLRHVLTGSVASSIHRDVSVGKIRFNLYRLKLDLDQLHVGERDNPQKPFVDLGHLTVKVSWTSLFRFAPVIGEVIVESRRFTSCGSRSRNSIFPICSRARPRRQNRNRQRRARR